MALSAVNLLESSIYCITSRQVYNGTSSNSSSLLTRICGSTIPSPVFIRSNIATIKFVTDHSITRRGYDFTYTASTLGNYLTTSLR